MSSPQNIQNELERLGCGLPVANSPVFSVPEGYFEGLAATISAKIKTGESVGAEAELRELSPLLASLPKAMPYSVPPLYFEQTAEAAETGLGILAAAGKTVPYQIPDGYFEALPQRMLAKATAPTARVVPLFGRTWMRVAAAATVCGALLFGGLRLLNKEADTGNTAKIETPAPVQTAQPQTAAAEPALQKELARASTKELEEFIETVDAAPEQKLKKDVASSAKTEVSELLKDVSVNEMESFLSALPSAEEELPATN